MEDIAKQLDDVRDEMVQLLNEYPYVEGQEREDIYERCEVLGGEIQELVGLLKIAIRSANQEAESERNSDPAYSEQIQKLSSESLAAIHEAGVEVSAVISVLRERRNEFEDLDEPDYI